MFLAIVAGNMVMQVAVMRAELTDDLNAAMRFGEVLQMTKLIAKELFLGMLVLQLLGFVLVFVTVCTLYLGLFPSIVVMQVVVTYMRAEFYRRYLEKGGQPLPIGPLAVEHGDSPTVGPGAHPTPAQF